MNINYLSIPVITDVERNIDGINMIRCSYYSIQSDTPIPDWNINDSNLGAKMLMLNLEAILVGPMQKVYKFNSIEDVDSMYEFADQNEGLFVDINDIWIPASWFEVSKIKQGLVYRIPQSNFILCWKFRNDNISSTEFVSGCEIINEPFIQFSEQETLVFQKWTKDQIQTSKDIYQSNKKEYLLKIKT